MSATDRGRCNGDWERGGERDKGHEGIRRPKRKEDRASSVMESINSNIVYGRDHASHIW